jgi:hypothetical protein
MMKRIIIFIALGIIVSFCLPVQAVVNVTYTVTDVNRTPISKYIYGTNFYDTGTDYTIQRIGGNRCTAYNWENNWSNAGSDYLFENDTMWDSSNPPVPGKGYTTGIDLHNSMGQDSIVTLQLAGYVSAPIFGQNLDQNAAPSQYFYPVQFAKGAPFCSPPDNPNTTDNIVYIDEFVNFLVWKYGYSGPTTGVKFYSLDNEVDIWDSTHKEVHPSDPCCQEIRDKSIACATAVKNVDPNAQITGPVLCVFTGFLNFCDAPDWSSVKGSRPWFISYYLDEMKKASDANGRRLLDVLDVHWYPPEDDGNGHGICDNREDPQTFNARMQAPRTLWDTDYVYPHYTYPDGGSSWVNKSYWAQFLPILTRFKTDIANYFPDTNIAITEYTWGPSTQWATGITTADFLGLCGKYGVYMTNYWGNGGYIDTAIKMYTNYDGSHSKFGDMNVCASMSDKVNSSIYGSLSSTDSNVMHIMVLNKSQTDDISGTFTVTSGRNFRSARVWAFDNYSSSITERAAISNITNNTFTYTIPKTSVCHIVLTSLNPPAVSITLPLDGDTFNAPANITIDATASVSGGTVTKVDFYQGSTLLGTDTNSPYSFVWNDVNVGRYSITAQATDNNGVVGFSIPVNVTVVSGDATGFILREWWTGISGAAVSNLTSDINYPNNPNFRALITSLEGPTNWADNYGTRIRGYVYPPANGNYTFWIASDDAGSLRLSTDDDPCHAVQIAYVTNWTDSRVWNKETNQQSLPKPLLAGHKYYIEALQKENGGGDNIAVAWSGPGITQQVIDGLYLSPWLYNFRDYSIFAPQWQKTNCSRSNAWCNGADRYRDGNVQIDDLAVFAEWWLYDSE